MFPRGQFSHCNSGRGLMTLGKISSIAIAFQPIFWYSNPSGVLPHLGLAYVATCPGSNNSEFRVFSSTFLFTHCFLAKCLSIYIPPWFAFLLLNISTGLHVAPDIQWFAVLSGNCGTDALVPISHSLIPMLCHDTSHPVLRFHIGEPDKVDSLTVVHVFIIHTSASMRANARREHMWIVHSGNVIVNWVVQLLR